MHDRQAALSSGRFWPNCRQSTSGYKGANGHCGHFHINHLSPQPVNIDVNLQQGLLLRVKTDKTLLTHISPSLGLQWELVPRQEYQLILHCDGQVV